MHPIFIYTGIAFCSHNYALSAPCHEKHVPVLQARTADEINLMMGFNVKYLHQKQSY